MESGVVLAIIGLTITVATLIYKSGRDRASIDAAISAATAASNLSLATALGKIEMLIEKGVRQAKHDAVNALTEKLNDLHDGKLSVERYEADKVGLSRRIDVIERQIGLDGTGPQRRMNSQGD